jgi:hypothetical protein
VSHFPLLFSPPLPPPSFPPLGIRTARIVLATLFWGGKPSGDAFKLVVMLYRPLDAAKLSSQPFSTAISGDSSRHGTRSTLSQFPWLSLTTFAAMSHQPRARTARVVAPWRLCNHLRGNATPATASSGDRIGLNNPAPLPIGRCNPPNTQGINFESHFPVGKVPSMNPATEKSRSRKI